MKTISIIRAIDICAAWHGGQWSALYQFASSGVFTVENTLRYFQEVLRCLHPEYWSATYSDLTMRDTQELEKLKRFFEKKAALHNVPVVYEPHELYGYEIPYLADSVPEAVTITVTTLTYPR